MSKSVAPWRWTLPSVSRTCDAAVSASSLGSEKANAAVWPKPAYICFCFGDAGEMQGKPTVVRSTGYRDADKMAVDVTELKSAAYLARLPGCHLFGVKFDTNGRPREGYDDLVETERQPVVPTRTKRAVPAASALRARWYRDSAGVEPGKPRHVSLCESDSRSGGCFPSAVGNRESGRDYSPGDFLSGRASASSSWRACGSLGIIREI